MAVGHNFTGHKLPDARAPLDVALVVEGGEIAPVPGRVAPGHEVAEGLVLDGGGCHCVAGGQRLSGRVGGPHREVPQWRERFSGGVLLGAFGLGLGVH